METILMIWFFEKGVRYLFLEVQLVVWILKNLPKCSDQAETC